MLHIDIGPKETESPRDFMVVTRTQLKNILYDTQELLAELGEEAGPAEVAIYLRAAHLIRHLPQFAKNTVFSYDEDEFHILDAMGVQTDRHTPNNTEMDAIAIYLTQKYGELDAIPA